MVTSLNPRVEILMHWLAGRRNGVGFWEMLHAITQKRGIYKSKKYIENIKEKDGYLEIKIIGYDRTIYYPYVLESRGNTYVNTDAYRNIKNVITDTMFQDNWHYYEFGPNKLSSNDIVVDIGACEGLFTLIASEKAKKVYAIEPLKSHYQGLLKTFDSAHNIEIMNIALGEENKKVFISSQGASSRITDESPELNTTEIDQYQMDVVFRDIPFTYLKADIEGYEPNVLQGAREVIAKYKPKISITTYHQQDHARWISSFLKEIDNRYQIVVKGVEHKWGAPVMLHAWID